MTLQEPLFLKLEGMCYFDEGEFKYKLTKKGEEIEAIKKSYEEFYGELEKEN